MGMKILFVEDSADDAELEELELRRSGFKFQSRRVASEADLRKALEEFKPDVVLSDYSIPGFGGLEALRLVKRLSPQTPFIFVSGTIGEDLAANGLKEGATDFVLKDRLGRLEHAVKRAVQESRDRRERARLEEEFRQSQKMEAVGRLAGGVAHDFNNLLMVINGYAESVLDEMPPGSPWRAKLTEVVKAGQRAAALTKQLLAFSRKQTLAPEVFNLNEVLRDVQPMLGRLLEEDVELVLELDEGVGNVRADRGQVDQVLMNLAVNARDAMPEGGRLTIATGNEMLEEPRASRHGNVPAGEYVRLRVEDTGHGMDEETQRHLFEPFFTTKPAGTGTGLGLSTVYGIVKQSGGFIEVESEAGKGSVFSVYLPRVHAEATRVEEEPAPAEPKVASARVLLIEDFEPVRRLMSDVLEAEGFSVLAASSGEEALKMADEGPVDLVITDMIMPGMSGTEAAQRIRAKQPGVKVVYASGNPGRTSTAKFASAEGSVFLNKPFTPDELVRTVSRLLGE